MKLRMIGLILAAAMLMATACVQPASTGAGLEIVEPWARAATMAPSDATANAAMPTTPMTATDGLSTTALMTASVVMSEAMPMNNLGMGGANSAIYMTIRNSGPADQLIRAESAAAQTVELHTVKEENGMMSMQQVAAIDVPANGEAVLKPGGFHVMLLGLTQDLTVGEPITVTLTFAQAGPITVKATVRER